MRIAYAVAAVALLVLQACDDRPDVSTDRDSTSGTDTTAVDTSKRLTSNLPEGTYQLPTTTMPVPDLWITLPEGYRVKPMGDVEADRFFIVHTADPTISDTAAVTPGFIRLYVGRDEQRPFDGVKTSDGENVVVIGQPLQWRRAEESLPDGSRYFQRDIGSADIFGRLSPDLARERIYLHIYVAGSDSARVAELMRSAETINIVPQ